MSKLLIVPVAIAAVFLVWFWGSGGFDQLAAWAAGEQRTFQNEMAQGLRALRAGEAGALAVLLSVCFAYGFFHAIGPGHGKILIGGYGLGRQVPWLRLSVIALLASLGQALTAILLVVGGILLFGLARGQMVGIADNVMAPISYGAIAVIGAWLVLRGARKAMKQNAHEEHDHAHHHHDHDHHHHHDHGDACGECGHRHGPSLEEIENTKSFRDALALIGGIAIRPCTGALFLLIITWQMGILPAGIAGTVVMALGTAMVTIAVGLAAVGMRGGLMTALSGSAALTWIIPMIEILAGTLIAVIASGLLLRVLG